METTLNRMKNGVSLYTRLRDLLDGEQPDLVKQELAVLEENNQNREALLAEIAEWEGTVAHMLGRDLDDSGEGATLSQLIQTLPSSTRTEASRVLTSLEKIAREARKLAKVNHILVERNLAVVELTLDAFSGGPAGKTYDAVGTVNRAAHQTLLTRRE